MNLKLGLEMEMSKLSNFGPAFLMPVAILIFGLSSPQLYAAPPNEPGKQIAVLQDFLRVAYPELFGKDRYLEIHAGQSIDFPWRTFYRLNFEVNTLPPDASFGITIDPHTGKVIPPPQHITLMTGDTQFNEEQIVEIWVGNSDLISSKQNDQIDKLIQSHPEWSDARAYEELKKAGARYGPSDKEQFVQSLHLERFENLVGRLKITSVEPRSLPENRDSSDNVDLDWLVRVDAQLPDGTHHTYALFFEVFGGRLIGLLRTDRPGDRAPKSK
jgi:hypothetical protein